MSFRRKSESGVAADLRVAGRRYADRVAGTAKQSLSVRLCGVPHQPPGGRLLPFMGTCRRTAPPTPNNATHSLTILLKFLLHNYRRKRRHHCSVQKFPRPLFRRKSGHTTLTLRSKTKRNSKKLVPYHFLILGVLASFTSTCRGKSNRVSKNLIMTRHWDRQKNLLADWGCVKPFRESSMRFPIVRRRVVMRGRQLCLVSVNFPVLLFS